MSCKARVRPSWKRRKKLTKPGEQKKGVRKHKR